MTNPTRGTVTITVDDEPYTLRFSINALCELEEEHGKTFDHLPPELEKGNMRVARSMFRAALRGHHPDITDAQAGEIMSTYGFAESLEAMTKAIALAFPAPKKRRSKVATFG